MLYSWLCDAIWALGFRAVQDRWGTWGVIWLLTGLLALAAAAILAVVFLR